MGFEQLTFFDEEPDELGEILKYGSGFEKGCLRIYAAYMMLDRAGFVKFLPEEFGVGGHSVAGGVVDYGGGRLTVRHWGGPEIRFTWSQVAEAYARLIKKGAFPGPRVVDEYKEAMREGRGVPAPRMVWKSEEG